MLWFYLTIFSVSRSGSPGEGNGNAEAGFGAVNPNTATPEEMFAVLRAHYPRLPEELLAQYVANIVDRRDTDNVPSELTLGTLSEPVIGIEITPYINEVCPDVQTFTEDGDDGQFVELINPYAEDFDLTGWRLETGTSTVYLKGMLPSQGLLVITDDYDDSNDPEPEKEPGFGSLYDVFGVVAVGLNMRVQEQETFDLNDQQGIVKLYDNNDNLVDSFAYTNGQFNGTNLSFQRIDPRVRYSEHVLATPLAINPGYVKPTSDDLTGLALFEKLQNHPIRTPLELLLVSTSYVPIGGKEAADSAQWRFPATQTGAPNNLDIAVVDLFQPGAPPPLRSSTPVSEGALNSASSKEAQAAVDRLESVFTQPPAYFGRINFNTASPAVLASLPGIGQAFAEKIAGLRGSGFTSGDDFPVIRKVASQPPPVSPGNSAGPQDPGGQDNSPYGDVPVLDEYGFSALGFGSARTLPTASESGSISNSYPEDYFSPRSPQDASRWATLSEFIRDRDLWGDASLIERMERIYPFSAMMTFQSLAYRVMTANIPLSNPDGDTTRRSSVIYSDRILAADRGTLETVQFLYGPRLASTLK